MLIRVRNGHKVQVSTVPAPNPEIEGIEVKDGGEDADMYEGKLKQRRL